MPTESKSLLQKKSKSGTSAEIVAIRVILVIMSILVIAALGLAAGLGGAALKEAKDPLFKAGARVLASGSNAQMLVSCINNTGAPASGYAKIGKGDTLTFYSSCPRPRITCEVSFCGSDEACVVQLAPGKQCSQNADCATEFGSNNYYCDTTTCTCVNGTGNATFCCDWIDFTPASVTSVNLTLDSSISWYQYRPSGVPAAHVELNGQSFILNSAGEEADYTIVYDISNTGLVLDSSGNYSGFATFFHSDARCTSSRVAATSSSEITLFFSVESPSTAITSAFFSFVFYANLQ